MDNKSFLGQMRRGRNDFLDADTQYTAIYLPIEAALHVTLRGSIPRLLTGSPVLQTAD